MLDGSVYGADRLGAQFRLAPAVSWSWLVRLPAIRQRLYASGRRGTRLRGCPPGLAASFLYAAAPSAAPT